jgi:hypothetical protein
MGLIRPDRATSFHSVMLPLFTDLADPMPELRRFGIDAAVAWHADMDADALVLIETDAAKRLGRLLAAWPKVLLVPEAA